MKLGRSYTVDVLLPDVHGGSLSVEEIPPGFTLLTNGRGAVRITARDRDRFGEPATLEHLMTVLCEDVSEPFPVHGRMHPTISNAEWQERFRHAR